MRRLSSCPFSLRWALSTQRHFNSREKQQGLNGLLETLQVSIILRTKFWNLSSVLRGGHHAAISCQMPGVLYTGPWVVSSFQSKSEGQEAKGEMGWLPPDPLPRRPSCSLKTSGSSLCSVPQNTLILSRTTNH